MCEVAGLSQRRACRLAGLSLSTCRYSAQRPAAGAQLSLRITELALERRRFGYRRIWQLLRREGFHVNHKRVYRIYHLNDLGVNAGDAVRVWRLSGFRFSARMRRT
jgi:putative transposase